MRRLIENLTPGDGQIGWKRIGGVFALYVVVMIAAALFVGHQSKTNVARDSAATMASDKKLPAAGEAPTRHLARFR